MLEKHLNQGESNLSTIEEQFAALFGKTMDGRKVSDRKFMKYESQGESFQFVITGDMQSTPQTMADGKKKFIVQEVENGKWGPKGEGTFDPEAVAGSFEPEPDRQFPVHVVAKKRANGDAVEGFEPFDTVWELRAGNRLEKLEEALLEEPILLGAGVKVIEKLLDKGSKPYKYSIKLKAA